MENKAECAVCGHLNHSEWWFACLEPNCKCDIWKYLTMRLAEKHELADWGNYETVLVTLIDTLRITEEHLKLDRSGLAERLCNTISTAISVGEAELITLKRTIELRSEKISQLPSDDYITATRLYNRAVSIH